MADFLGSECLTFAFFFDESRDVHFKNSGRARDLARAGRRSSQVDLKLFRCLQRDRFGRRRFIENNKQHTRTAGQVVSRNFEEGEYWRNGTFSCIQPCSWFSRELRIAHWRKKENGKPQSSDRSCKNLTKYSSPVIEASWGARCFASWSGTVLPTW